MLIELHIENFAIIDRVELKFGSGLVTFTGETGAGKSILIDAVKRCSAVGLMVSMIRTGADRAYVEGVFQIETRLVMQYKAVLEREDLLDDPTQLTIAREISSQRAQCCAGQWPFGQRRIVARDRRTPD